MNIEYKKKILLEKLFALHRFGIKPGLERTLSLLDKRDNPHKKLQTIHIAGTNGKGSVAAIIASVLKEAGYKTGLYTSPHIRNFNERIRINGEMITDEDVLKYAGYYLPEAEKIGATFFEITTAMAFDYFYSENTDIAVIETGMGGRFDSTNVIKPLLGIITNIGLEHMEYLGDTLEKIAFEKAGIIKDDMPVILGNIKEELTGIFTEKSQNVFSAKDIVDIENIQYLKDLTYMVDLKMQGVTYEYLKLNLAGFSQIDNLISAFAAFNFLFESYIISEENIRNGLRNIKLNTGISARMEMTDRNLPLIADVAHNTDAILNLVNTLDKSEYRDIKWNIMIALMSDKDAETIISILAPFANELIITKPKTERAGDVQLIKKISDKIELKSIIIENPSDAFIFLKTEGKPSIVVGSFYLIGEIYHYL